MNTRRKFLLQGGMATIALLTAKPVKTIANMLAPLTGYSIDDNTIVLVHTGTLNSSQSFQTLQQINSLKENLGSVVHLYAGAPDQAAQLKYDATLNPTECVSLTTDNYKIIYKGNFKIGVITASVGQKDTIQKINTLSAFLKKEKGCQVVMCFSQLGFKNKKTAVDDMKLANSSTDLDIIIGAHPDNFLIHPVIAQNSKRAEVIIHSDSGNGFAFRNIEIKFDAKRNKKTIAFNNLLTRQELTVA